MNPLHQKLMLLESSKATEQLILAHVAVPNFCESYILNCA